MLTEDAQALLLLPVLKARETLVILVDLFHYLAGEVELQHGHRGRYERAGRRRGIQHLGVAAAIP
jgi:hypothetical protein